MNTQIINIGAGIVELATAYQIQMRDQDVLVTIIEKEDGIEFHQTGNNC